MTQELWKKELEEKDCGEGHVVENPWSVLIILKMVVKK
jgi:hypothetical protein